MSQTSYSINQPVAFAGLKVDIGFDRVESYLVEESAGIRMGLAVAVGTDKVNQVELPTAAAVIRGITVHEHNEKALSTGANIYADEEAASVLRQGLVWMPVSGTAPAVDAAVYAMVDTAAAAGFATSAAGTNNILIPTAVCRKTGVDPDGNTIVAVEINLP